MVEYQIIERERESKQREERWGNIGGCVASISSLTALTTIVAGGIAYKLGIDPEKISEVSKYAITLSGAGLFLGLMTLGLNSGGSGPEY